jgi:hypothetical protein
MLEIGDLQDPYTPETFVGAIHEARKGLEILPFKLGSKLICLPLASD